MAGGPAWNWCYDIHYCDTGGKNGVVGVQRCFGAALGLALLWALSVVGTAIAGDPTAGAAIGRVAQAAQLPARATNEFENALRNGGVRLTAAEIRTLLLGATFYDRRPADGAEGATYVGQDGTWRSRYKLQNGQIATASGVAVIANDAICFIGAQAMAAKPACPSKDVRSRAVVRKGSELVVYFTDVGSVAAVVSSTRRGNPENI